MNQVYCQHCGLESESAIRCNACRDSGHSLLLKDCPGCNAKDRVDIPHTSTTGHVNYGSGGYNRIEEVMRQKKLKPGKIADAIGKSHDTFLKYRRNQVVPDCYAIFRIAEAMECDPRELVVLFRMPVSGRGVRQPGESSPD